MWPLLVVIVPPGFDQLLRAREIRFNLLTWKRPTGEWQPFAPFEIDFIQRARPAAPMIGASAKIPKPRCVQRDVVHAGFFARITFDGSLSFAGANGR